MGYCSAITKKEILPFVTTWMDLEGTMLSEIIQTENGKYYIISVMWNIEITTHRNKSIELRLPGARRVGESGRCWSKGTNFQLKDEQVLGA